MNKILTTDNIKKLQNVPRSVLVGGCFDVLHKGHFEFLKNSKQQGDKLIVLLESDENVKKLKGENRPVNNQKERANILTTIKDVDYIILLDPPTSSDYYYNLVKTIKPDIIAITKGDPLLEVKKEQAESVGGKVIEVMERDKNFSTTDLIKKI